MKTWIKFCGTTSLADALASVEAGADALGFIFAPSKRQIMPEKAREITRELPQGVERVGVFVDESAPSIISIAGDVGLTAVQLHGKESPEFVSGLQARGPRVIKTVLIGQDLESDLCRYCANGASAASILLDSGAGSGKVFDWRNVRPSLNGRNARFIVAGGLTPENVGEAIQVLSPWGVDVVSGIELEPGRKDLNKLKTFVAAVREAEQR